MSSVYFCSDFHLGHNGVSYKFRKIFQSDSEHDEYFLDMWSSTITKRDIVYCLGDMAFTKEKLNMLSGLYGNKKLIMGNHDLIHGITINDLVQAYDSVEGITKYKGKWLSHAPMHPSELYGKFNIHGHVHFDTIMDSNYINVCPEASENFNKVFYSLEDINALTTDKERVIMNFKPAKIKDIDCGFD